MPDHGVAAKFKGSNAMSSVQKTMPCFSALMASAPKSSVSDRLAALPSNRRQRGFTLIEVMVVIVILGVLAALVVPRIMSKPDEARVTAARYDIGNILQALDVYRLDNQRYPSTEQGLQALAVRPTVAPVPGNWKQYLKNAPTDPWGRPYQYLNPGIRSEIDVFSYGADGQPGGEGTDADIGSWSLNR